jgi:hypothetical protein
MGDRFDVLSGRKYTAKDGTEKTAWTKLGTAFMCRDGVSLNVTLDALPLDGRLYITPPKEFDKPREARSVQAKPVEADGPDDNIPF